MLILLDLDGVMIPATSWKKPEFLEDGFPMFSRRSIEALQKIISETSADILLTTSHKSKYSIEEWTNIFSLRGLKLNKVDKLEDNANYLNRKDEIMSWVNRTIELPNFIIIDDDKSLNELPKFVKDNLIQTSALVGLTNELAMEALKIASRFTKDFS
jgi:hypothetical protein